MAYGSRSGGFRSGGFRQRRDFGPREMTKITCSECGKEDEVPFKPREGSSVLCKDCFMKKKGIKPTRAKSEEAEEGTEEAEESEETEEESQ